MLNPINEMRRLSSRSYDDLLRVATTNYGFCPNGARVSKVELITYIVTVTAIRDQFADMIAHPKEATTDHDREKYCLRTEDEKYYLRLTTEQVTMLEWCLENEINFYNAELESVNEVKWETP